MLLQDTGSTLTSISHRLNSLESSVPQVESQLSTRLDAVESNMKDIMNHVMESQNSNFKLLMDQIQSLQSAMAPSTVGIPQTSSIHIPSVLDESHEPITAEAADGTKVGGTSEGI